MIANQNLGCSNLLYGSERPAKKWTLIGIFELLSFTACEMLANFSQTKNTWASSSSQTVLALPTSIVL